MINLAELTHRYPHQNANNIQQIITEKREFAELALPKDIEKIPARGELFKHQRLAVRYLNVYDFLMLDNDPGTGKTGIGFAAAIDFNKNHGIPIQQAYSQGKCNWIAKTVILVPGPTVAGSWARTYGKYNPESDILPENIEIEHFITFYKRYRRATVTELRKTFDHTFFVLDEIQDLINRSETSKVDTESMVMYNWYKFFFRVLRNIKIVLASGTPIIMNASELGLILNLFPDMDLPVDEEWWAKVREPELEKLLRGRISHVKNVQKRSRMVFPPEAVSISSLISIDPHVQSNEYVVPVIMSKKQSELYYKAHQPGDNYHTSALTSSISAIPDEYIIKQSKRTKTAITTTTTIAPGFISRLENPKYVEEMAIKLATVISIIKERPGIIFIISKWQERSIKLLKELLRINGFDEYDPKTSSRRGKQQIDPEDNIKRPRFIAIDAESGKGDKNQHKINYANKRENRYGDFVKVVVTARVGGVAISLHNVQTYIVIDPDNHASGEKQRENRIFRPDSYDDIYDERIANGNTPEEATVEVMTYRLVAIPYDQSAALKAKKLIGSRDNPYPSVDLLVYKLNIEKDAPLDIVRLSTNRIAFDAQLHIARNQITDKYGFFGPKANLGSDVSTFKILYGDALAEDLMRILVSTLMIENSIDITQLLNRVALETPLHLIQIPFYRRLSASLFNRRRNLTFKPIYSDYGYPVYLGHLGDTIFIQSDITLQRNGGLEGRATIQLAPASAVYTNITFALNQPITTTLQARPEINMTEVEFGKLMDKQDNKAMPRKVEVIESILIAGADHPLYRVVMRRFLNLTVFKFRKPVWRINFLANIPDDKLRENVPILTLNGYTSPEIVTLHVLNAQFSDTGIGKYDIYTTHLSASKVSILDPASGKFQRLEGPSAEKLVYSAMISDIITRRFNEFRESLKSRPVPNKIFSLIYDPDLEFRILDDRIPPEFTREGNINKATAKRGKVCHSYDLDELVDIAIYLGLRPEPEILDMSKIDRSPSSIAFARKTAQAKYSRIVDLHPELYSDPENILLLVNWIMLYEQTHGKKTKEKEKQKRPMCSKIYEYLSANKLIYYF